MNQRAYFVYFLVFGLFLVSFVFAAHNILTSSGSTIISVNEDVSSLYNISVNISDSGAASNVSNVTIFVPANFTLAVFTTFNTSLIPANYSFTNSSSALSWVNVSTGLIGAANLLNYFWFNATVTAPGNYNITVATTNATSTFRSNISVTVNDTTVPSSIFFTSTTLANSSNRTVSNFLVDVNATDNAIANITIYLYNSAFSQINLSSNTSSPAYVNFSGLSDGTYYWNATVYDIASPPNVNSTETRRVIIDTTGPSISISTSSTSKTELSFSITTTDAFTVSSACTVNRSGASVTGTGASQTFSESSLSCGTSYSYLVTCSDSLGNSASNTKTASTDGCSGSSGSDSGSSTTSTTTWTNTYSPTADALSKGYEKNLSQKERIRFKIGSVDHHVGALEIKSGTAKIEVASTPQTATMSLGETKKFDVNNDAFYDIMVKLISIKDSKGTFLVTTIKEAVPASAVKKNDSVSVNSNTTGSNDQAPATSDSLESVSKGTVWMWIGIGVVVIALLGAGYFYYRKSSKYNHK